jgi:O6-methylguanine-DNA--protein-cysteine methyltransferase
MGFKVSLVARSKIYDIFDADGKLQFWAEHEVEEPDGREKLKIREHDDVVTIEFGRSFSYGRIAEALQAAAEVVKAIERKDLVREEVEE